MPLTSAIKRAPKWAWWTVGGIGAGALAIKLYRGRATDATPTVEPGTDDGTGQGIGSAPGSGVIVPPVIISPPSSDPNAGVSGLADLFMSGVLDVTHQYQELYGPIMDLIPGLVMTPEDWERLMRGGDSPGPAQPGPVVIVNPPAAPAPAAPPVVTPPSAPAPSHRPCPSSFPFWSDQNNDCYKVVCASGNGDHSKGRWHYLQGGRELKVASTC